MAHGFAERRRFAIDLDPGPLATLRSMPIRNRMFVGGLLAALAGAWADAMEASATWFAAHAETIARLRALGGRPFLVIGDSTSNYYDCASVRGEAWLLPMIFGFPALTARGLGTQPGEAAVAARALLAALGEMPAGMPVLLRFGHADAVFTHKIRRLRAGPLHFDPDEFAAFSRHVIARYVAFLERAVPGPLRARVVVLGLLPSAIPAPMWAETGLLAFHAESLRAEIGATAFSARLERLELLSLAAVQIEQRRFNALLRDAVALLGFGYADHLDLLLDPYGNPVTAVLPRPGEHHLDRVGLHPLLTAPLWHMLDAVPAPPA